MKMRKNDTKLNNVVEKKYGHKHNDYGLSYTNSSFFALPMLNISLVKLGKYFFNCFVKDNDYETLLERPLFLSFKYEYKTLEEENYCKNVHKELLEKEEFITFYYAGNILDSKTIIYLFNVNDEFKDDYNMFLQGKYSKFRTEFKEKFSKYFVNSNTGRREKTITGRVVNKDPELKEYWENKIGIKLNEESEVWSKPNIEEIETI